MGVDYYLCGCGALWRTANAGTKLLVTNLDPEIVDSELKELFESIGPVRSASIKLDADRSKVRNSIFGSPVT